jgi:Mg-chelatase subunit ChlD
MRILLLVAVAMLLLAVVPGAAQDGAGTEYHIKVNDQVRTEVEDRRLFVTVRFKIERDQSTPPRDASQDEVVIREDGVEVARVKLSQPVVQDLAAVLAMDVSGSMEGRAGSAGLKKIDEAKQAAHTFLDKLGARADVGLVLFDHEMKVREKPTQDPARYVAHQKEVLRLVDEAQPAGGTAYLDAASVSIRMLKGVKGRKAVVVMTDGVDMNSTRTLPGVIEEAKANDVPVYTVGIGEPGKYQSVTTVLVLDHSGSMRGKADATDKASKIEALRTAASRFVELMGHDAQTTLLPFSTNVEAPGPFSTDRATLKARIAQLQPEGGTLLYDATYAGIETLLAARPKGKKAVVVLTDGKDESPGSRCSDQLVIDRAKEEGIPLYMLGLGRPEEINQKVMERMAAETGGKYFYVGNQQRLFEVFEKLSIDLHDDGIDEKSLRELAEKTGGKYFPAHDVSQLHLQFEKVASELQSTYELRFRSNRSTHDGTARGIVIKIVDSGGHERSNVAETGYTVHGVVVPEMEYRIYLVLLVLVCGLLLFPAGVRRLHRLYGGQ